MRSVDDLRPALARITAGFYQMYRQEPVMTAIWQAAQADRALQDLDKYDCEYLASLLSEALLRVMDNAPREIETFSRLTMTLVAATVRYAITLDESEAKRVLAQFERMLPEQPAPACKRALNAP